MSFLLRQSAVGLLRSNALNGISAIKGTRSIKRWVAPTLRALKRRKDAHPVEPHPRSTYLEFNYDAEVYAFGKRLGEEFNEDILKTALTHRSYNLKHNNTDAKDNRELIDEGETFIKYHIGEYYGGKYPGDAVEALKRYLTTDGMLGHVAKHMGLSDIILCQEYPVDEKTLADTFKAVVAALKASSDEDRTKKFVHDFLLVQTTAKEIFDIWHIDRPYEYMTDLLKERGITEIEPRLCNKSAANTILANYQVGLYNKRDKKLLGIGWGETIEMAKETAALDAIDRFHIKNRTQEKLA